MIPTLLKPSYFSIKNDFQREYKQRFWNRTTFATLFVVFILYGLYSLSLSFFLKIRTQDIFTEEVLNSFLSVMLLALLSVTFFSAVISALGSLFSSKELHLLLIAPVSLREIYFAKFSKIYCLATWMFVLIAISFGLGLKFAFHASWLHTFFWIANFFFYSIIPTSLGIMLVIIFSNIIPAERLREVIILTVILGLFMLLSVDHSTITNSKLPESFAKAILISKQFPVSQIEWLPNNQLSKIISKGIFSSELDYKSSIILCSSSLLLLISSYLFFKLFFLRGWAKSTNTNVQRISYKSDLLAKFGNFIFSEASTIRAFAGKELRSFLRDTTQSVQLLLLLTLTFIYLYNFRVMHASTIMNESHRNIWSIILSIANIIFSGCVISAICTRFVYPSISLEGPSYQILRTTPVSLKEFIKAKFLTWYIPISVIGLILFVSGAWAISADFEIVLVFAFFSLMISASSVALAIGVGGLYARFDWDNPIQVISSFGSLVYMLIAMITLGFNLIPASILFGVYYSSFIQKHIFVVDRTFVIVGSMFLMLVFNGFVIKRSLIAAESYLASNEKIN